MKPSKLELKIMAPTHVLVDSEVSRVTAEALNGHFCLLPRHIDFVTALTTGILSYETPDGREHFVALHGGILVKCGSEVLVSTRDAVIGDDLGLLQREIETRFAHQEEREAQTRAALTKLEHSIVRRFMEIGEHYRG